MSMEKINILRDIYLNIKPDATVSEFAKYIKDVELMLQMRGISR